MGLLIFYVLLALTVSFLCSIIEAVLLSVTPSYVSAQAAKGSRIGSQLSAYKEDIERPLAAILSLNTIAHTLGATGAGAQAATIFGNTYIGIFAVLLTLLILFFSEIVPKTLGAVYWRELTPFIVRTLGPIIWLMWPLVKVAKVLTQVLSKGEKTSGVSREEIHALATLGEQEGVFEEDESRILKNLFRFGSIPVREVMTPRTVLFTLPENNTVGDVLTEYKEFRFSRIPIFGSDLDDITGYVLKDDLLMKAALDEIGIALKDLKRPIFMVSDHMSLSDLFERLIPAREHIALVVDEYGGTAGIVTQEDLLETLLGLEIIDEADHDTDMQVLAHKQWLVRARRLGIISEDYEEAAKKSRDARIKLGLKGVPPQKW